MILLSYSHSFRTKLAFFNNLFTFLRIVAFRQVEKASYSHKREVIHMISTTYSHKLKVIHIDF